MIYLVALLISLPIAAMAAWGSRDAGLLAIAFFVAISIPLVLLMGLAWQGLVIFWGPALLGFVMGSRIRQREVDEGLRA